MLMIAISIVFSGRSTVSPSQDSRLFSRLLASLSIFYIIHSLQERKERLIHAAKLLNINKSAKQNNKFIFTLPVQTVANRCCKIADRYWLSESRLYTEKRFGGDDAVASPPPLFLAHAKTQSSKPIICP